MAAVFPIDQQPGVDLTSEETTAGLERSLNTTCRTLNVFSVFTVMILGAIHRFTPTHCLHNTQKPVITQHIHKSLQLLGCTERIIRALQNC